MIAHMLAWVVISGWLMVLVATVLTGLRLKHRVAFERERNEAVEEIANHPQIKALGWLWRFSSLALAILVLVS